MKKAILVLLVFAGFTAGAQNFIKEYPLWNSGYGNQFVSTYADGYATVGTKRFEGQNYIMLIRTDLNGDTLFTKTLIDTVSNPMLQRFGPDSDGCHYLTFRKNGSTSVAQFSPDWDLKWIRSFGFGHIRLIMNRNNDLLVAGAGYDIKERLYLHCLTSTGNTIWEKNIISQHSETPITILELENGDISIPVKMYQGFEMVYYGLNVFCFSASGDSLSYKSVPLNGTWASVRQINANNDTLAIIYSNLESQDYHFYLMHTKADGTLISEKEISLFDANYFIYSTLMTPAHEIVMAGIKEGPNMDYYSTFIYAMSFNGDSLWSVDYGNYFETDVSDIQLCPDGGYIVSGNYGNTQERFIFLMKTDSLGSLNNLGTEHYSISDRVNVYPNPANEYVVFETQKSLAGSILTLSDITGRQVAQQIITSEKTVLPTAHLEAGVYLYQIENGQVISTGKVMVVK